MGWGEAHQPSGSAGTTGEIEAACRELDKVGIHGRNLADQASLAAVLIRKMADGVDILLDHVAPDNEPRKS